MALSSALQRRVRATKEDEESVDSQDDASAEDVSEYSGNSDEATDLGDDEIDDRSNEDQRIFEKSLYDSRDSAHENRNSHHKEDSAGFNEFEEHDDSETSASTPETSDPKELLSTISFGALVSAQESLGLKRKRSASDPDGRKKIRSLSPFHEVAEREAGKKIPRHAAGTRSSKHAPAEQSSKKAVSRKRQVVAVPTVKARDPRFSSLSGSLDMNRVNQKYAFLNDYRALEIAELKQQARDTKDPAAKKALRQELKSMEDRERTKQRAEEERAVVREHRKQEREKIEQGKKPFFLKKGDVRKQALVKRFEGMGEKKAEKIMEKRRKKKASKDKRVMPRSRRKIE